MVNYSAGPGTLSPHFTPASGVVFSGFTSPSLTKAACLCRTHSLLQQRCLGSVFQDSDHKLLFLEIDAFCLRFVNSENIFSFLAQSPLRKQKLHRVRDFLLAEGRITVSIKPHQIGPRHLWMYFPFVPVCAAALASRHR